MNYKIRILDVVIGTAIIAFDNLILVSILLCVIWSCLGGHLFFWIWSFSWHGKFDLWCLETRNLNLEMVSQEVWTKLSFNDVYKAGGGNRLQSLFRPNIPIRFLDSESLYKKIVIFAKHTFLLKKFTAVTCDGNRESRYMFVYFFVDFFLRHRSFVIQTICYIFSYYPS